MFFHWPKAAEEQLLEQTKCRDMKHLTSKSEYLVKMIGEHLTGQKEWHPSSKQAPFPQPPKQTVVTIAKETKKFFFFKVLAQHKFPSCCTVHHSSQANQIPMSKHQRSWSDREGNGTFSILCCICTINSPFSTWITYYRSINITAY